MISDVLKNQTQLFDVAGKTALITGASGSFGRGIALALASLGAKVVLASGSQAELDEVANEVKSLGGQVTTIARRPDSLEDAQAMLDTALSAYGQLDMLVVASGYNKPGFIHEAYNRLNDKSSETSYWRCSSASTGASSRDRLPLSRSGRW